MGMNFTNLNVNPCKMCMPMGAVTAMYGIQKCMSILHGSQGCSTYIRRHMATHYNEPVDIASSSLTEQGTVFGGEKNLLCGLENLIRLYEPEMIGVATSCLAETIGEDVPAIIRKFYEQHPEYGHVKIFSLATPGYGGTQFEGYFRALRALVSQVEMEGTANHKINIITGPISPADTRFLKELLEGMGLDYILLPDLSENLDGGHQSSYKRLPQEGTSLRQIREMAGARYTIELSSFLEDAASPAVYLQEKYGVPWSRLHLPCGLQATDALIEKLEELGGKITEKLLKARSRYLDALVDSHKYNALGRAAVFGEPDFVRAIVQLCAESGIVPVAAITGSVCHDFSQQLTPLLQKAASVQFVKLSEVQADADFETLERKIEETNANLMIGSSDGRRIAARKNLPLVRCAFPVHDHIGGQRIRMLGYEGSLQLLDQMTNHLIDAVEGNFRQELYEKYYTASEVTAVDSTKEENKPMSATDKKTAEHPCFTCGGGQYARMHLPIAPACNIQCNYCLRKYDCPNESRPGVTTEVLSPAEAAAKYRLVKEKMPNLKVVGIAGPGDALANFPAVKETLQAIRAEDPEVTFCLSTNGLMLPFYAEEIISLGVSHLTVTINAVDPQIGARIYKHIDYLGMRYTGESAAGILLANQLAGLKYMADHGVICKVNIVVLRGINEAHIENVVKKVKELGAYITNIMQMIPVQGSAFEDMELVSLKEISALREACGEHLLQMKHCRQCRADAIGTLDHDVSIDYNRQKDLPEEKQTDKQRFAVASKSGMLVDQHFGHAQEFYIYESDGREADFIERRSVEKYCRGNTACEEEEDRIGKLLHVIEDCGGVLALRVGDSPQKRLKEKGIRVIATYDSIENAVRKAAQGI